MNIKLERMERGRMIAGVCAGVAAYLGLDITVTRLAFLLLIPASGIGLALYLVLWIIMPLRPVEEEIVLKETAASQQLPHPQRNVIIGIFLLLVGLYLLAQTSQLAWLFWPALFIGLGLFFLRRRA